MPFKSCEPSSSGRKRKTKARKTRMIEHPQIRRGIILSGPRRVGKTTIMYQMIEDNLKKGIPAKNILYVSFDHPMLKLCDIGRIIEIFQNNLNPDERELYLFFDEIQYAQDWDLWLKTLYDRNPSYHIMATGSASPILAEKAKESGVGRWTTVRIPTLSFYEYIDLRGVPKPTLSKDIFPTALGALDQTMFRNHCIDPLLEQLNERHKTQSENAVRQISVYIREHLETDVKLEHCCKALQIPVSFAKQALKEIWNTTFMELVLKERIDLAKKWLLTDNMNVEEIARRLQYSNAQNFSRTFKKIVGVPPGQYRVGVEYNSQSEELSR